MDRKRKINKIALISPKRILWAKNPQIHSVFHERKKYIRPWYSPPLSLLTIASVTPPGIHIQFIDEDFEQIDFKNEFDLVAISAMTQQALRGYEIAHEFKKRNIPVIMGGIHPTVLPYEALKHVDSVIIGEGEILWNQCLEDFQKGELKKIYKSNTNNSYNLLKSPIPRYDLLGEKYLLKNKDSFNMMPIQVTRGCPHDCNFCLVSRIYGKKIRKKSIRQILLEIKTINKLFGNTLIMFADDNLFVDKKFIKSLLKAILPLGIRWVAQSDVAIAKDEDLIRLAYRSGCVMLLIGFESLNKKNLLNINNHQWKMNQVDTYSKAVQIIQKNGILVYAAFIVGFDHDTKDVFIKIRDFMSSNYCTGQFTILTPLPGTKLYEKFKMENRLIEDCFWDRCNFFDIVFYPQNMTIKELEDGFIWLYMEIFNSNIVNQRMEYMKGFYKKLPFRWKEY